MLSAPAALRNRGPILAVLGPCLDTPPFAPPVRVLEIASGSGEHAVFLAGHLPSVVWQPSDVDDAALASIEAHRQAADLGDRLREPIRLDAAAPAWVHPTDVIVCINMIHISPWEACERLFAGASRSLPDGGVVFLYGPYRFHGVFLAPSNEAFDASLRARDPRWGVRDVDAIDAVAQRFGLWRERTVDMPAENHCLVYRLGHRPP